MHAPSPLELAPNKFHDRPSGASKIQEIQENLLAAGLRPDPAGGAYSAPPDLLAKEASFHLPKNLPPPAVGPLSLWLRPFGPRS